MRRAETKNTETTRKGNLLTALIALGFLVGMLGLFVVFGAENVNGRGGRTAQEVSFLAQFRSAKREDGTQILPDIPFSGPDGTQMRFADFHGKYLVLNVWAAWCPPCLAELPSLQRLRDRFRGTKLEVVAISADTAYSLERERALGNRYGFDDVALYHDTNARFQDAFALYSLPVTFVADPQGRILYRLGGDADWTAPGIVGFLEGLEKGSPSTL